MSIKPQRIYVAGALSSKEKTNRNPSTVVIDYIQNISAMCKAASVIKRRGHYPYTPGLDFLIGIVAGDWEEEDYRGMGMEFLKVCDAVLVISDSWGVQQELKLAEQLGIPIYYNIYDICKCKEVKTGEDKEKEDELEFDKCVGQFRLTLNTIMRPLRIYGQKYYVDSATEEIVSLAIQLYLKLEGVDMPYQINHDKLRG